MNSLDFEVFTNYNNSLKTNDKIQFRAIHAKAKSLFDKKVYAASEVEELLIADGYKETLVKEALEMLSKDDLNDTEVEKKVTEAAGMPKKYSDIAQNFEKVLASKGANFFVKVLTEGQEPLMKISRKELETFQRIADLAYENPVHFATLHAYMKPSITSELAENVCKARRIKDKCSFAQNEDGSFRISHKGKIIEASAKPVKSTSEKFSNSNYGTFGFPDEYVVLAYEESDPYSKIKKDLN